MFPGFEDRLKKELTKLWNFSKSIKQQTPVSIFCRVIDLQSFNFGIEGFPDNKTLVFTGASLLGEIMKDSFYFWMNRVDYLEQGEVILNRWCNEGTSFQSSFGGT